MILTVTLNTSIDKAYYLEQNAEVGSVMRVSQVIDGAGGKGINASRAIATCKEDVLATGFVGGHTGKLFCDLLEKDGIRQDFTHVSAETRSCINILEPNQRSTEFLEPGREVNSDEIECFYQHFDELAQDADVVSISGSVPKGCSSDTYQKLIHSVKNHGIPVILDTSGELLTQSLTAAPDMIKPNTDEIEAILGEAPKTYNEIIRAARSVRERFGIAEVVVSLGAQGALMACADGVFSAHPPKITVVNPVGSGDTMVGAFAVAYKRQLRSSERLAFGIACATANCLTPKTGNFDLSVAEELLSSVKVSKIG